MEIFLWVVLGSLAGAFVTSTVRDRALFIRFTDVFLGALGAVFGGLLAESLIPMTRTGLYDETILLAVLFAGLLIWIGRIVIPKSIR